MGINMKKVVSNEDTSSKRKTKKKHSISSETEIDEAPIYNNNPKKNKKKKSEKVILPVDIPETIHEEESELVICDENAEPSSISKETPSVDEDVKKTKKKKRKHRDLCDSEVEPASKTPKIEEIPGVIDADETVDVSFRELESLFGEHNKTIHDDEDFYNGWSKEDLAELFSRMRSQIPSNDSTKSSSRALKLDWEKIAFNNHTISDCQQKWKFVEKRLRGFRLLEEMLNDANHWLEKPWTDFYRSEKRNRHPGMPKKPLTSFMIFYIEKKKRYSKKFPNLEMSKLSKIIADKFNSLSETKKDKYKTLAQVMRDDYNEKLQKFYDSHPNEAPQTKTTKTDKNKEKNCPSGPKKPVGPFKMFYLDKVNRLNEEGNPVPSDFLTECKEKWKVMSNRKKIPWIRWAHEAEVKYLEEATIYTNENPSFEAPPHKSVLTKVEKDILDRVDGKPEKPPNSAYALFSRLMLKDDKVKEMYATPKQRLLEIGKLWKEVPGMQKNEYVEKVKELQANYKLEYATYLDSLSEEKRKEELANNIPKKKVKPENLLNQSQRKLKQTTLNVTVNPRKSSMFPDKEKRTNTYTLEELFALLPPQPPTDSYILFRDEYLKKGLSEKKAMKAWELLSEYEKKNYDKRLADAKKEYLSSYQLFLESLKPAEVKMLSEAKNKNNLLTEVEDNEVDNDSDDNEDSDDDDDDDSDDEKEEENRSKIKIEEKKKSSDDDSSEMDNDSEDSN